MFRNSVRASRRIGAAPDGTEHFFYRTYAGAAIDLVLGLPNGRIWAIKVKRSLSPKVEKGFHLASGDPKPERAFVVYPGNDGFPLAPGIEALNVATLAQQVSEA